MSVLARGLCVAFALASTAASAGTVTLKASYVKGGGDTTPASSFAVTVTVAPK